MDIRLYNTMSGAKETFEPMVKGKVGMYVCGPTVYDACHIGHARSQVVFDVIARYFEARGYEVTYVRNFTDIDDKIIRRAKEVGVSPGELAQKYIDEFYRDMDALYVRRATIEPRATEYIGPIIDVIQRLIDRGRAYDIDGDVFFAVESFEKYGQLSGRKLKDMVAGARVDVDRRKRNPFDFALWKAVKPGEPSWESPWGPGRPGWHIECSAMSCEHLGTAFDIHGGGQDLIFPHHENEIAQSESAFNCKFARYWVHNGFVKINKEKMSKSLGNFLMIKDVLETQHPEAVRLFLLSKHYRSPIDFSDQALTEAGSGLDRIYALQERLETRLSGVDLIPQTTASDLWVRFCEAMDDDFNTAAGIGTIFELVHQANRLLDRETDHRIPEFDRDLQTFASDLTKMGQILGIMNQPSAHYFSVRQSRGLESQHIDPTVVEELISQRTRAREAKEWATADRIRLQLEEMNITVEDRPDGTLWKINT